MSKKMLSLALALVMCLGLTLPACAVGQPGDTTITDTNGNYTLSNPILYTISRTEVENINMTSMKMFINGEPYDESYFGSASDYLNRCFWSGMSTVYALPEGTVVTLPANLVTETIFELDVTVENGTCHATEFGVFNYPGFTSVTLDDGGYVLGVELRDIDADVSVENGSGTGSAIGAGIVGTIFFYVPEKGTTSTDNPFSSPTPTKPTTPIKPAFIDVAANAYYADAVAWAVEKNITAGTSATTFSPDQTCTNAQILTFLWRAKGSPAPRKPIPTDQYYAQSGAWAVEQGIVDTFLTDIPCTRAMVVTYLWKLAGSPNSGTSNFSDVSADADYAQAVAWAVGQGVTSGTSTTTFSPDATCTRGQIVTFLYRAFAD